MHCLFVENINRNWNSFGFRPFNRKRKKEFFQFFTYSKRNQSNEYIHIQLFPVGGSPAKHKQANEKMHKQNNTETIVQNPQKEFSTCFCRIFSIFRTWCLFWVYAAEWVHVQIGYVIPSLNSVKIKNKQIRWSAAMLRFRRQTFDRGEALQLTVSRLSIYYYYFGPKTTASTQINGSADPPSTAFSSWAVFMHCLRLSISLF